MTSSPDCTTDKKAAWMAAIPDAVAMHASAPSSSATAASSAACVGFEYRLYEWPGRRNSRSSASSSALATSKVLLA
jgi:hypothetical protein